MKNRETLIRGCETAKRVHVTLKSYLIEIKRRLKGIKGVFTDAEAGHFFVLRSVLVCLN